ncbi:MAG: bifunctional homocysteine S-methyltransferase/methylenetetrahydrofolate reductase [Candidatus Krumholzibacteriota bacterium]|nr:bifunctional homocysteine S-methyltransferase/methylenetetrahydrofolate reductase [Candidatus Krumholzibacteriota bacterium]
MGTCLYERGVHLGRCFDAMNVEDPDLVRGIHRDYAAAGAQVLTTNTFGANAFKLGQHHLADRLEEINRRGAELARESAGAALLVAGSVGPLGVRIEPWGPTARAEARAAFARQAAALAGGGADLFILETFSDPSELMEAVRGAREAAPELPVIAQMTLGEDGSTFFGAPIEEVLPVVAQAGPDALGLNCTVGPELMLEALERVAKVVTLPLSIQPNAGFPKQMGERYFYLSSPDYFARYGKRFVEAGARIVGGCCGTTPEHVRALARALRAVKPTGRPAPLAAAPAGTAAAREPVPMAERSGLAARIAAGRFCASVELVPPRGWGLEKMLAQSRELAAAGFDAINIPDGPRATARLSPLATAVRVQETGIEALLHYVCRDRNLLGMQADLLGAYALGLRNLLLITGDPPVRGDYPEATPVFDVDSVGLTNLVTRLNHGLDVGGRRIGEPTGFLVGVGANPTAVSFDLEVERFYWKVDAGAEFAITQPVFDVAALDRFLAAVAEWRIPVLAGIWPLQSLRNAEFLDNEVPGVSIPAPLMARMRAAAGDPEAERAEGLAIALEMARAVLPRVAGLQVGAPFNRGEAAMKLLAALAPDIGAREAAPAPGRAAMDAAPAAGAPGGKEAL